MSDAVTQTIELIKAEIKSGEAQLAEKRRMVNSLCAMIGQPQFYAVEAVTAEGSGIISGEFYGQPLAAVVRKILEKRRANGPQAVTEIYEAMKLGDYRFDTANAENAKRSLRISLTKNSIFHRLPSGKYGLREWYPAIKDRKGGNGDSKRPDDDDDEEAAGERQEFEKAFDDEAVAPKS